MDCVRLAAAGAVGRRRCAPSPPSKASVGTRPLPAALSASGVASSSAGGAVPPWALAEITTCWCQFGGVPGRNMFLLVHNTSFPMGKLWHNECKWLVRNNLKKTGDIPPSFLFAMLHRGVTTSITEHPAMAQMHSDAWLSCLPKAAAQRLHAITGPLQACCKCHCLKRA